MRHAASTYIVVQSVLADSFFTRVWEKVSGNRRVADLYYEIHFLEKDYPTCMRAQLQSLTTQGNNLIALLLPLVQLKGPHPATAELLRQQTPRCRWEVSSKHDDDEHHMKSNKMT